MIVLTIFSHVFCFYEDVERPVRNSEVYIENTAEEGSSILGKGKGKIDQRVSLAFT